MELTLSTEVKEISVKKIVKYEWDILNKLLLPSIQRDFVWDEKKVIEFLDSLYRGYPIGVITILKAGKIPYVPLFDKQIIGESNEYYYLIDGQQRLTSLLLLANNWCIKRKGNEIKLSAIKFSSDEQHVRLNLKMGKDLSEIINNIYSQEKKYRDVGERILEYSIPFVILNATNIQEEEEIGEMYEEIGEMFVRVNRGGMKLGNIEMFLSFFLSAFDKKDLRTLIRDDIYQKINDKYAIDIEPVLRFIFYTLDINQNNFSAKNFKKALKKLKEKESEDGIIKKLKECKENIFEALTFLSEELGINKYVVNKLLPSQNTLVPIFAYFHESKNNLNKVDKNNLIKWFILSNYKKIYSQSTNSKIQEHLMTIKNQYEKNGVFPINELKSKDFKGKGIVKGITIEDDILIGYENAMDNAQNDRNKRNHIFLLYCLLHINKAKDFAGNLIKDSSNLHIHHICPQELLHNICKDEKEEDIDCYINDFSNLTFIDEKVNIRIKDKNPNEYFNDYKDALVNHFIPSDKNLWNINKWEDYNKFTIARANLLKDAIKKYLA